MVHETVHGISMRMYRKKIKVSGPDHGVAPGIGAPDPQLIIYIHHKTLKNVLENRGENRGDAKKDAKRKDRTSHV